MRSIISAYPLERPLSAGERAQNTRVAQMLVEPTMRHAMITEAAYYRAQRRGFAPGHELDDWLAAEIEIDEVLVNARLK
jgi:hypothetical protein